MTYLKQFNPPLLTEADTTLRGRFELGLLLQGRQPPPTKQASRLFTAYLIVVDKAIREYRAGCSRVQTHMGPQGGIRPFVEGLGHFETCINSVKRSLRLLSRLGSQPDAPSTDRILRRLAQSWDKSLTEVRDAIEHIDQDIISDQGIQEADAHLLTIASNGLQLEISTYHITFSALHETILALYRTGLAMIEALPNSTPSLDA